MNNERSNIWQNVYFEVAHNKSHKKAVKRANKVLRAYDKAMKNKS